MPREKRIVVSGMPSVVGNARQVKITGYAAALIAAASILSAVACNHALDMEPLPPPYDLHYLTEVPLIVLGEALEKCHPVGGRLDNVQLSRWNNREVQLWTVKVKVQHVIRGDFSDKLIDVFYFVDQEGYTGPWSRLTDIQAGHTEIFFLQSDGGNWRTVCDGWRYCVLWVRTGSHYQYKIDRTLPVAEILVNLLLSRGDRTSDQQMMDAIYHPEGHWGWKLVFNRLKQLEREEKSPPVRAVILDGIHNFRHYYGMEGEQPR